MTNTVDPVFFQPLNRKCVVRTKTGTYMEMEFFHYKFKLFIKTAKDKFASVRVNGNLSDDKLVLVDGELTPSQLVRDSLGNIFIQDTPSQGQGKFRRVGAKELYPYSEPRHG